MNRRTLLGLLIAPGTVPLGYLVVGLSLRSDPAEWLLRVLLEAALLYGVTLLLGVPLFRALRQRVEIGFREVAVIALVLAGAAVIVVSLLMETNAHSLAINSVYYMGVTLLSGLVFWFVAIRGREGTRAHA